jgi:molybdenum cofactor cytidylyltransferase
MGDPVTPGAIASVLTHLQGGLRQIPARAQRSVLLTQADTLELQAAGQQIARQCLVEYRSVVLASLAQGDGSQPRSGAGFQPSLVIYAIYEPTAGILLAAGGATRLGRPKQLLTWQDETFVHRAARTALVAGLSPLVVVTGAWGDEVAIAVSDLPVQVANNPEWETGQGSSVRAGILALPATCGAAVFLLSDQPQIPSTLIEALLAEHARTLGAVVAPLIDGRRGNPVCFDRSTFQDLAALSGDTGGRALFSRFPVTWLPWQDASALLDVDTEEDYRRLTGDHSVP